jgi:hypothetical protein
MQETFQNVTGGSKTFNIPTFVLSKNSLLQPERRDLRIRGLSQFVTKQFSFGILYGRCKENLRPDIELGSQHVYNACNTSRSLTQPLPDVQTTLYRITGCNVQEFQEPAAWDCNTIITFLSSEPQFLNQLNT